MLRLSTILLSILGLCIGIWAVATADEQKPEIPLARPPVTNPFPRGIAALGIVEPAERNIFIIAPEPGVVTQVFVSVGDAVTTGTPLFQVDTRRLDADLLRATSSLATGEAAIARWHALPRQEDLPPLAAAVASALALLNDRIEQQKLVEDSASRGSGTGRDVSRAVFAVAAAQADLTRAQAQLASIKAGGWAPDLVVLTTALEVQRAEVAALQLIRERLTVRSPRDATVLRRLVEPGQNAPTDSATPALILGNLAALHIRAQVDEEDIGLITSPIPSASSPGLPLATFKASARTRGAFITEIDLELVRIEPFAHPKTDLLGLNSERVDTRVIDVVLRVIRLPVTPVFPGQAVNVFIAPLR